MLFYVHPIVDTQGDRLPQETELTNLQEELNEIRGVKRLGQVAAFSVGFVLALASNHYGLDFVIGLIIWIIVGTGVSIVIHSYFRKQEARIVQLMTQPKRARKTRATKKGGVH